MSGFAGTALLAVLAGLALLAVIALGFWALVGALGAWRLNRYAARFEDSMFSPFELAVEAEEAVFSARDGVSLHGSCPALGRAAWWW